MVETNLNKENIHLCKHIHNPETHTQMKDEYIINTSEKILQTSSENITICRSSININKTKHGYLNSCRKPI